jgi:hypothetical protein
MKELFGSLLLWMVCIGSFVGMVYAVGEKAKQVDQIARKFEVASNKK